MGDDFSAAWRRALEALPPVTDVNPHLHPALDRNLSSPRSTRRRRRICAALRGRHLGQQLSLIRLFSAFSHAKSIFFASSADGGTTWSSPPRVLNVAPAQTAVFPAVAALNGT